MLQSSQTLKTVFFSVWLLLVASVIIALANQDKFFAMELHPIATLDERVGQVMARTEGLVRWREVVDHQGLYDGDRVATGGDAKSTIRFDKKRTLQLGEDTQVQITAIQQADGALAFMITLFRGSMAAETDGTCTECPPLILRDSGGETYNVASGKKVALVKAVGKKAKTFDPKTAWPVTSKAERPRPLIDASFVKIAMTVDEAAERVKKETEDKEEQDKKDKDDKEKREKDDKDRKDKTKEKKEKDEKDKKDKEVVAKGFEAVVTPGMNGRTLWTMEPLAALGGESLEIALDGPAQKPENASWRPALELSGKGAPVVIEGANANSSDLVVKVTVEQIRRVAAVSRTGGLAEYVFTVRGGAIVAKDKDKQLSFSDRRAEMRIKSFGEVGGGPVTVSLDGLKAGPGNGPWMDAKSPLTSGAAAVAVSLASGGDFGKLAPFIRGGAAAGLSREALGGDGIFVVRSQAVVAQIRGANAGDKATAAGVLRALGGDLVFKGSRAALYDMRGKTQTALVDWVGALLDKGKVLYILKKNKLYPVSRDFIKTNNEVAQFIDTQARAIFLEKVEILDYR